MFFNNSSLPLWAIVASGTAVIVLGVFTYTFYNNIFFHTRDVHIIYKNLRIYSLIVVAVVVILGVFIGTFYNINIKDFFTTIYCSIDTLPEPENVSQEIRVQLGTFMHLHYQFPDNTHFDIADLNIFLRKLFIHSGKLDYTTINEMYVYTIKANDIVYTVHPNVIEQAYKIYGLP
jgi:hypothetical protein